MAREVFRLVRLVVDDDVDDDELLEEIVSESLKDQGPVREACLKHTSLMGEHWFRDRVEEAIEELVFEREVEETDPIIIWEWAVDDSLYSAQERIGDFVRTAMSNEVPLGQRREIVERVLAEAASRYEWGED